VKQRAFGGELIDVHGAVDLHCHPFPDLFPRVADDLEIVIAARDAGLKAIMMKCHNESTVSRAYFMNRMVPGIRVYGGIVLNRYVGAINPAAVEAALRLGGKAVWMPTIDAGYHAQVHGGAGGHHTSSRTPGSCSISLIGVTGSGRVPYQERIAPSTRVNRCHRCGWSSRQFNPCIRSVWCPLS